MIKKIMLFMFVVGCGQYAQASEEPTGIQFKIPPLAVNPIKFDVSASSSVPVEHKLSISPSTAFAVAGLFGLYQTAKLVNEGIQKCSDLNAEKNAEGKRLLFYSSLLGLVSSLAILTKLVIN
jgi:hypothetical protein